MNTDTVVVNVKTGQGDGVFGLFRREKPVQLRCLALRRALRSEAGRRDVAPGHAWSTSVIGP